MKVYAIEEDGYDKYCCLGPDDGWNQILKVFSEKRKAQEYLKKIDISELLKNENLSETTDLKHQDYRSFEDDDADCYISYSIVEWNVE